MYVTRDQMLLARRAHTSVRRLCVHEEITAHRKICLASRVSHGDRNDEHGRAAKALST